MATYSALSVLVSSNVSSPAAAAAAVSSGASPGGALLSGVLLILSLYPHLAAAAIMTAACFLVRQHLIGTYLSGPRGGMPPVVVFTGRSYIPPTYNDPFALILTDLAPGGPGIPYLRPSGGRLLPGLRNCAWLGASGFPARTAGAGSAPGARPGACMVHVPRGSGICGEKPAAPAIRCDAEGGRPWLMRQRRLRRRTFSPV